jgi:hypothetical protein
MAILHDSLPENAIGTAPEERRLSTGFRDGIGRFRPAEAKALVDQSLNNDPPPRRAKALIAKRADGVNLAAMAESPVGSIIRSDLSLIT